MLNMDLNFFSSFLFRKVVHIVALNPLKRSSNASTQMAQWRHTEYRGMTGSY